MTEFPPIEPADHSVEFSIRWAARLDPYCVIRINELGIPDDQNGEEDPYRGILPRAFVPEERTGGHITMGITINSGVFNSELLKAGKGGRIWAKSRLRDRIDAIIAHEWEEGRHGTHPAALKAAPKTELPISAGARRILKAMGRSHGFA